MRFSVVSLLLLAAGTIAQSHQSGSGEGAHVSNKPSSNHNSNNNNNHQASPARKPTDGNHSKQGHNDYASGGMAKSKPTEKEVPGQRGSSSIKPQSNRKEDKDTHESPCDPAYCNCCYKDTHVCSRLSATAAEATFGCTMLTTEKGPFGTHGYLCPPEILGECGADCCSVKKKTWPGSSIPKHYGVACDKNLWNVRNGGTQYNPPKCFSN